MASFPRLIAATLAGAILLVAPIAIWTVIGDGDLLRTAIIGFAALLLSCAAVRQVLRPIRTTVAPHPGALRAAHAPAACRSIRSRPRRRPQAAVRGRNAIQPRACRAAWPRPTPGARLTRDVRCLATGQPLARRVSRRRTRP